jgi:hypothetical protein
MTSAVGGILSGKRRWRFSRPEIDAPATHQTLFNTRRLEQQYSGLYFFAGSGNPYREKTPWSAVLAFRAVDWVIIIHRR